MYGITLTENHFEELEQMWDDKYAFGYACFFPSRSVAPQAFSPGLKDH